MKKGEVSTSFLVEMLLLILGFAVLLSVFLIFDWGGTIDSQTCHASVVARGTVPEVAKSYVPLKCQTEKLCLTSGGLFSSGSCDKDFSGIDKITKVKVNSEVFSSDGKTDAKTQIEKTISQEVIDCWTMMGSGKISISNENLDKQYGLGQTVPFCVICSRISVDSSLRKKFGENNIVSVNPFEYMRTHKIPEGNISYLDFIIGSGLGGKGASFSYSSNTFRDFDKTTQEAYSKLKKEEKFDQLAVIYMQAYAPSSEDVWDNYMKTFFTSGIAAYSIAPSTTTWATVLLTKVVLKNPYTLAITAAAFALAAGYVEVNTLNNQVLTASYCGDITSTNSKTSKGCSVVRVVPYNSKEINSYCGIIDGLP